VHEAPLEQTPVVVAVVVSVWIMSAASILAAVWIPVVSAAVETL
jgi:uncharacterized membrane protein